MKEQKMSIEQVRAKIKIMRPQEYKTRQLNWSNGVARIYNRLRISSFYMILQLEQRRCAN